MVIPHGDAAPVLDAPEQDLGCMSLFVEGFVVAELSATVLRGWMQGVVLLFFNVTRNRSIS